MSTKILFWLFILLGASIEIIGDIYFKKFTINNRLSLLLIGLAFYFIGSLFWALSLRYELLSKAISIFTILNLVIISLVGVLYFKEDLSNINKIGIILGIISILFIEQR